MTLINGSTGAPPPRKRPEMRRCSICWEWVEHVGFIHDKRCMACEGTGYVDCDPGLR